MYSNNDRVSIFQMINIIVLTLIGVGILTLPRELVEVAYTDGWMVLLAGGVIAMGIAALHGYVIKSFPEKGYFEILTLTLNKPIAYLLSLFFIIYLIGSTGFIVRIFSDVVKTMLLPRTPIQFIILAMLVTVVFLVRNGIEPLGRLTNIIFPSSVIVILILFALTFQDIEFCNLRPYFQTTPSEIMSGLSLVIFGFLGFELLLIFGRYIDKPQKAIKIGPLAVGMVLLFYVVLYISTITNFSVMQVEQLIWPTISVFKTIDLPGAFIENVDVMVMAIWIFTAFTTLDTFYLGSAILLQDIFAAKEHQYFVLPILPVIFFVSMYSRSIADVYHHLGVFTDYTAYFIILGLPVLILLAMLIRKTFKKNGKESM